MSMLKGLNGGTSFTKGARSKEKIKANSNLTLTGIALSPKNGAIRKSPVNRTNGHQSIPSHWVISVKVICIRASQPCLVSY
ncbi:hypothetical protein VCR14J2_410470 [Vibrio coralliirubri]|nr:hypothetical protein VCR12J2_620479 [Vibrio coralliirubri]CDU07153.1 hypothetical protein VCR14J2_410470 [Vibrio coralliirubri]